MFTHVTTEGFGVSKTTGTGIDGAILHVTRIRWTENEQLARRHLYLSRRESDGKHSFMVHCSHDGMAFADNDTATRFAVERGYLQRYFTSPDLRARRVERAAAA